ncbi:MULTISPECIES: hypothetical protein [Nitrincola]|uniref:Uncharacterized protein n=1 Tax=Nitrincola nitratireducens TaxID=1229521 RepID=W9V2J0_9GAMM|nr:MULTISPECIES: hypothetical protein [Nitrincola]EXJ11166.1 hypothetical protein D791_01953 [Nitrincola nitratireducens]
MRKYLIAAMLVAVPSLPMSAQANSSAVNQILDGLVEYRLAEQRRQSHVDLPSALTPRERDRLLSVLLNDYMSDRERSEHRHSNRHNKYRDLPPGLQRKMARSERLPRGWQRKLVRGEVMPQELYRYATPLPANYRTRARIDGRNTELVLLGDKVVRLVEGRGTIVDVIDIASVLL